ncbi:MAG: hypothetical protein HRU11_06575 [Parvularculaceae bacterium]|nr:hypothetical protein [Parvularculaceae bacterium]
MLDYGSAALVGTVIAVGSAALVASSKERATWPVWLVPGVLTVGFGAYSIWPVINEGPLGFWANHSTNGWGLQVWWDLLMAVVAAFFLMLPRARAVGMSSWPWVPVLFCTGSIGLFAMLTRMLYLEHRDAQFLTQ